MTDLQTDHETWGRPAYEAYAATTGWRTFDGRQMPAWGNLGEPIQAAWDSAAQAVRFQTQTSALARMAELEAELSAYKGDDQHRIEFRNDGWTLQHPMACRPNLFDCEVNRVAGAQLQEPPAETGRFTCWLDGQIDGSQRLVIGARVEA